MRLLHRIAKGRLRAPFFAFAALCAPLSAQADTDLQLRLPIDCTLGETCYIQQYVDRDPGPAQADYACGTLANDGHSGTDFAVPTEADMARGVPVLATAAGTIRAIRDGMPDIRQGDPGAPDVAGLECGNAVAIEHGNGWETQYCHLREGSVTVASGQRVEAGAPLGMVGMSGLATFPHVHLSVRKDGAIVDPFSPNPADACGAQVRTLWSTDLPYMPGGPIAAGFASAVPDYTAVKAGLPEDGLDAGADAAVVWILLANVQSGDTVSVEITAPNGPFLTQSVTLEKAQPLRMQALGRRLPSGMPADGSWSGTVRHTRGETLLGERTLRAHIP